MSVHVIQDDDVILLGVRDPSTEEFRDRAQQALAKALGFNVKVILVVDAPGLFEVMRRAEVNA